jgi:hypothetical protein
LLTEGFQHRLDGRLLDNFGLNRIIPRQVDNGFDRYGLSDWLRRDDRCDRLRLGCWRNHCRDRRRRNGRYDRRSCRNDHRRNTGCGSH